MIDKKKKSADWYIDIILKFDLENISWIKYLKFIDWGSDEHAALQLALSSRKLSDEGKHFIPRMCNYELVRIILNFLD